MCRLFEIIAYREVGRCGVVYEVIWIEPIESGNIEYKAALKLPNNFCFVMDLSIGIEKPFSLWVVVSLLGAICRTMRCTDSSNESRLRREPILFLN